MSVNCVPPCKSAPNSTNFLMFVKSLQVSILPNMYTQWQFTDALVFFSSEECRMHSLMTQTAAVGIHWYKTWVCACLAGAPATIFNTRHQFSEAQEMGRPSFECSILAWSCWPYLQVGLLPSCFFKKLSCYWSLQQKCQVHARFVLWVCFCSALLSY